MSPRWTAPSGWAACSPTRSTGTSGSTYEVCVAVVRLLAPAEGPSSCTHLAHGEGLCPAPTGARATHPPAPLPGLAWGPWSCGQQPQATGPTRALPLAPSAAVDTLPLSCLPFSGAWRCEFERLQQTPPRLPRCGCRWEQHTCPRPRASRMDLGVVSCWPAGSGALGWGSALCSRSQHHGRLPGSPESPSAPERRALWGHVAERRLCALLPRAPAETHCSPGRTSDP